MTSDPLAGIHLRRTDENVEEIEEAATTLGQRVGLGGVLEHLNREATRTRVPGRAVDWGFRWNDSDGASARWWPQGVTTSADASDTEDVEGRRLLMTSWYSQGTGTDRQGSRVTVVDLDTLRYRHVLLVLPRRSKRGRVVLRPLTVHAGGLVWFGPYLHVAGTRRGLFSARLEDVLRVEDTRRTGGHRYVLPVRFGYDAAASEGVERMRYSFLSLDRGSHPTQLLAGEYGRGQMTRRLVRYPLDPASHHLAAHEDGTARPVWLDERGLGHMQGAAVAGQTYVVTVSRGSRRRGELYVGEPGAFRRHRRAVPVGPEDVSYWPGTDRLWSLTEHPGRRYVFCVDRSRLLRRGRRLG